MSDVLQRILSYKREEVVQRKRAATYEAMARKANDLPRPIAFEETLRGCVGRPALIAEIKKASPSKGLIRRDFDPAALARAYTAGGAACLSVLTDNPSFQGADEHVLAAKSASPLPVLRKEFIVDPWQVLESRSLGADAILLIMAAVDDVLARDVLTEAKTWGLEVLLETHDEAELERGLELGVALIGINNRSLSTFVTDLTVTERLAPRAPKDRLLVSESGISTHADIERLEDAGARAFLVGESLMRQSDVEAATRTLLGA